MLNATAREIITSAHLAHLVTLNPDGSPQVTMVWIGLDGEEIVAGHLGHWKKLQNIERDPRVTLSIETGRLASNGLAEYLVIYGNARVTAGGGAQVLQDLAHVYLGPEIPFPPMENPPAGFVTHVAITLVAGNGDWLL